MKEKIELPEKWRDWTIVEEIGHGAYGTVYRAERFFGDLTLTSAIKIIKIDLRSEANWSLFSKVNEKDELAYYEYYKAKYEREITALYKLKGHSHIVSIEDFETMETPDHSLLTIFIRMELLTGLQAYANTHGMEEKDIIQMGLDLCDALTFCNNNGIIHRDIKPNNIFVKNGRPATFKLGDFGVAISTDNSKTTMAGTPRYLAPEIVKENKQASHQTDLYALGLVLYELSNQGKPPYTPQDKEIISDYMYQEILQQRLTNKHLPPPATASAPLAKIILKACAFNSNERYRSAAEMQRDLARIAQKSKPADRDQTPNNKRSLKRLIIPFLVVFIALFALGSVVRNNTKSSSVRPAPTLEIRQTSVTEITKVPIRKVDINTGCVGCAFKGETAVMWYRPSEIVNRLAQLDIHLTDEEIDTYLSRDNLSAQFTTEENYSLQTEFSVIIRYTPTADFSAFLESRQLEFFFDPMEIKKQK